MDQAFPEAIGSTLHEVGQAIVFTTFYPVSVFLCFIPVNNVGVSRFSILALIAVLSALVTDLLLLPACVGSSRSVYETNNGLLKF
ncbi:MAG: hypothetical protein Ct9H300mP28_35420 [Pseudomonadota bacterium]|nr:MAG: hypothetical protein Ct9H300mP28_35420 [Pseudomonadota bacterium]